MYLIFVFAVIGYLLVNQYCIYILHKRIDSVHERLNNHWDAIRLLAKQGNLIVECDNQKENTLPPNE